jgi:hypothetical protein
MRPLDGAEAGRVSDLLEPALPAVGEAVQVSGDVVRLEPWLGKAQLAEHLACSERWIELRMADGMPYAKIAGRIKFKPSEVEAWLAANGYLERVNGA